MSVPMNSNTVMTLVRGSSSVLEENSVSDVSAVESKDDGVIFSKYESEINVGGICFKTYFYVKRTCEKDGFVEKLDLFKDPNKVSDNIYTQISNSGDCIGMVFYMEPEKYSDIAEENENLHIRFCSRKDNFYPVLINKFFDVVYGLCCKQVVVGHEHGDKLKKCHLQVCVCFKEKTYRRFLPGKFVIKTEDEDIVLLFMQQKARNSKALKIYCKKGHDFCVLSSNEPFKDKTNSNLVNNKEEVFGDLIGKVRNREFESVKDIENYIQDKAPVEWCTKIDSMRKFAKISFKPKLEPFEWTNVDEVFPWLNDFTIPGSAENMRVGFMSVFKPWYFKYCINGRKDMRKKAFCLYSNERGLGKTYFATHLVNSKEYYLKYSFIFSNQPFDDTKKLLILDDVKFEEKDLEMWKQLVCGGETVIRALYFSEPYDLSLPCIITTNDFKLVKRFVEDKDFQTQVIVVVIDKFMGKVEHYDKDIHTCESIIPPYLTEAFKEYDNMIEQKKLVVKGFKGALFDVLGKK